MPLLVESATATAATGCVKTATPVGGAVQACSRPRCGEVWAIMAAPGRAVPKRLAAADDVVRNDVGLKTWRPRSMNTGNTRPWRRPNLKRPVEILLQMAQENSGIFCSARKPTQRDYEYLFNESAFPHCCAPLKILFSTRPLFLRKWTAAVSTLHHLFEILKSRRPG